MAPKLWILLGLSFCVACASAPEPTTPDVEPAFAMVAPEPGPPQSAPPPERVEVAEVAPSVVEGAKLRFGRLRARRTSREFTHGVEISFPAHVEKTTRGIPIEVVLSKEGVPVSSLEPGDKTGEVRMQTHAYGGKLSYFVPYAWMDLEPGRHRLSVAIIATPPEGHELLAEPSARIEHEFDVEIPPRVDVRLAVRRIELRRDRVYDRTVLGEADPPDPRWILRQSEAVVARAGAADDTFVATWDWAGKWLTISETDKIVLDVVDADTVVDDLLARFVLGLDDILGLRNAPRPLARGAVARLDLDVELRTSE